MAKKPAKGVGSPLSEIEIKLAFTAGEGEKLLQTLQDRFEKNISRHPDLAWAEIQAKLAAQPGKVGSLYAMENTGGEPDVIGFDQKTGEYLFVDCSAQSPQGRRSICYDGEAQAEREKKGVHPAGNALDLAAAMGIEILDEDQYRALQELGEFDTTTSSWIATPLEIREQGGAIFADRRYGQIFVYHNSAPSFYSARGFRGTLRV